MTPVVTVMNMKGGVGKTTCAVHLAWAFGWSYDKSVLIIDYDPQSSASHTLLPPNEYFRKVDEGATLASALMPSRKESDPFSKLGVSTVSTLEIDSYTTKFRSWNRDTEPAGGVWLIPGDLDLMRIALTTLDEGTEKVLFERWKSLIEQARKKYDLVIIDCHPAGSFFTKSAILTSDFVVVPVSADAYASMGLTMMRKFLNSWKPKGGARHYAVLFNRVHRSWDRSIETRIRADDRFRRHCVGQWLRHSSLVSGVIANGGVASETGRPNCWVLTRELRLITDELQQMWLRNGIVKKVWSAR